MVPSKSSPSLAHRSTLLTRPETEGLSLAEVNLLSDCESWQWKGKFVASTRNTNCAPGSFDDRQCCLRSRAFLAVGKGFTIPPIFTDPSLLYVALGHVHRTKTSTSLMTPRLSTQAALSGLISVKKKKAL